MKVGFVALVGAGPGNPGLLTLRAKALLEQAEVVVYDRLVSKSILGLAAKNARLINVGKRSSDHLVPQEGINQILLQEAQAGNNVVRLKGGDPFIFGRGGEELELLVEHGIPFEVVPGISSSVAAPAFGGIPVTHRDFCSSFHVITGHQKENEPLKIDFEALVRLQGTLIFLMGVSSLPSIVNGLMSAGMPGNMPAAMVENGTNPKQRKLVSTLQNITEQAEKDHIHSPAVIIVGKVCTLAKDYDWFTKRPLFGKTVVVPRPLESTGTLAAKLENLGAAVLEVPCVQLKPLEAELPMEELKKATWLAFTSKNGVEIFFEQLRQNHLDTRALGNKKIAAIGSQTGKELQKYGIIADYIPEVFDGAHLGEGLCGRTTGSDHILLLRAQKGAPEILEALKERSCKDIPLYTTELITDSSAEIIAAAQENERLYAAFTSASTVEGFASCVPKELLSKITGVCIGAQTAQKAAAFGIEHVVAEAATIDSLLQRMVKLGKDGLSL